MPEVIAELETCGRRIMFGDDNVMIHPKHSHELFEAMVPLAQDIKAIHDWILAAAPGPLSPFPGAPPGYPNCSP